MAPRVPIIHPKQSAARGGYMLDTLVVSRRGGTADSEGNPSDTMSVVGAIATGHLNELEPKRGDKQEGSEEGRDVTIVQALLVLAPGTDIRVSDQVLALGRTYIVRAVDKQRLKVRCWCEREL